MVQTPLIGLLSALAGFTRSVFQASITIWFAVIGTPTGAPPKPPKNSASSVSVFLYGILDDPASAAFANISAIGQVEVGVIPYITIFNNTLSAVQGTLNRDLSQYFKMIHPDSLPGKLEGLKKEYPNLIVVNISDPAAAVRLAELCCQSGIPFITLALFSGTEHLKELIEASSIPAVILPTEAVERTDLERQRNILTGSIRATTFLAEKVAEGTRGCFLREHLPA